MKRFRFWLPVFCAAAVFGGGCSSVVNSREQKGPMMADYVEGRSGDALRIAADKLREPHWYNSSTVNTGDEIMWRLEAGLMSFNAGDFPDAVGQFRRTEELIAAYDDRAAVSLRDGAAEAAAVLTNLNALPYRGWRRDRIALGIYKSLAYLGSGDEAAFRAQLRRLRDEQKNAAEEFRQEIKAESAGLENARREHPAAARQAGRSSPEAVAANRRNADFAAGMREVKSAAARGYGDFLNPMAIFLSALGSIRDGDDDNARIDFERLPGHPLLRRYLATVLRKTGRPLPAGFENVAPFDFPLDRDSVYVIFANGRGAAFRPVSISFPVMAAWPVCEFYRAPFQKLRVAADGRVYETEQLADMDAILAQEYNARLPGMIARIILSTLVKDGAYYTGLVAIGVSNMSSEAKALAAVGLAVAGAGYRALMNTADTRSWESLPKEFQLTQLPMPRGRKIALDFGGGKTETLVFPPGCRSAIVFVNAPGPYSVSCRILPFYSK